MSYVDITITTLLSVTAAPAQEALEYEPKTFTMGLGRHKTIYEGDPSPEVDKAWLDMFNGNACKGLFRLRILNVHP